MRPNQYHRFAARMTVPLGPALNRLYDWFIARRSKASQKQPIIFILGAPRTGTTIAYQCITHALDVSFPSHLAALFPSAPAFGLWFAERLHHNTRPHRSFKSMHGYSLGDYLRGPNEWDTFFRWFVLPGLQKGHERVACSEWDQISNYIDTIANRPLVVKILNATLHLDTIGRWFPSSRFLVLHRPLRDTVRSIYLAKRREGKPPNELWYVRPQELSKTTFAGEFEQIIVQIKQIYCNIDRARMHVGAARFLDLELQALCARPPEEVTRIKHWIGPQVRVRPGSHVPTHLEYSAGQLGQLGLEAALSTAIMRSSGSPD